MSRLSYICDSRYYPTRNHKIYLNSLNGRQTLTLDSTFVWKRHNVQRKGSVTPGTAVKPASTSENTVKPACRSPPGLIIISHQSQISLGEQRRGIWVLQGFPVNISVSKTHVGDWKTSSVWSFPEASFTYSVSTERGAQTHKKYNNILRFGDIYLPFFHFFWHFQHQTCR